MEGRVGLLIAEPPPQVLETVLRSPYYLHYLPRSPASPLSLESRTVLFPLYSLSLTEPGNSLVNTSERKSVTHLALAAHTEGLVTLGTCCLQLFTFIYEAKGTL